MTSHTPHPWRRLAALTIALLAAVAVAGISALALSVWAAAAIGVLVGQLVSTALEAWDRHRYPDLVVIVEAGAL
ncbi:MAG: hypothetical protein QM747_02435 [Nocardioides sp.]